MIAFPQLDRAWLTTESGQIYRKTWMTSVIEASRRWLAEGGDALVWLEEFQDLREHALKLGWQSYVPEQVREHLDYIRFGSAGRGEDLPGSDLDYAIVTDGGIESEQVKKYLYDFIRGMNDLGFPPCKGFVMGTNPRWIGSSEEWCERINHYFSLPNWENVRYLVMMVDGRPLSLSADSWAGIVHPVREGIRNSPFICWEMAHLGIHKTVALDMLGRIKTHRVDQSEHIHVKDGLLNPIIHSVRLLAIRGGCDGVSTLQRLNWLESQEILSTELTGNVLSALKFGWRLRVCQQVKDFTVQSVSVQETVPWGDLTKSQQAETMVHLQTAKALERLVHRTFPKPR